ncbi:hypothetical protein [Pyrofollis japonicus]|uniref:hypothetical protein n=1 Tax=Pyrofollis japonicus TaxID=3060460 RepID=UPI00295AEBD7|nr:hypothetical protein [Pyrofollis japonicus]
MQKRLNHVLRYWYSQLPSLVLNVCSARLLGREIVRDKSREIPTYIVRALPYREDRECFETSRAAGTRTSSRIVFYAGHARL